MKKLSMCCNDYLEKIKPISLEPKELMPFETEQLDLVTEVEKWNKRMDETLERAKQTRKEVKDAQSTRKSN